MSNTETEPTVTVELSSSELRFLCGPEVIEHFRAATERQERLRTKLLNELRNCYAKVGS